MSIISSNKTYLCILYPSCLSICTVIWISLPAAETGNLYYTALRKLQNYVCSLAHINSDVIVGWLTNYILKLLRQQYFDGEKIQRGIYIFNLFIFLPPTVLPLMAVLVFDVPTSGLSLILTAWGDQLWLVFKLHLYFETNTVPTWARIMLWYL